MPTVPAPRPVRTTLPTTVRRLVVLPLLTLVVLLAAGTFAPAPQAGAAGLSRVERATRTALAQIGDPYRYGAAGPRAFDCSGLVYYSFRRAGLDVPRTSAQQGARARHIRKSRLHRGDLMFFTSGRRVYHVAIFLRWVHGRAQMLHAPGSGKRVTRAYAWTSSWYAGTLRR